MAGRAPSGVDFEAAVQEALFRAWMQPPGEIESLDGWLRAVALNCARSERRRRDSEARALGRLVDLATNGQMEEEVLGRAAWVEVLGHLSDSQRKAVALHYLEDRSVDDVAVTLGVSPGTVKTHLHRARAKLARLMERTEPAARPKERRTMTVKDWFLAGSHPHDYEHEFAENEVHDGKPVVVVRCVSESPSGFGTLMQQCAADEFIGHRVRFSGWVRSRDVTGWAGLWLRVDGAGRESLAFDNMQDRSVKGMTPWTHHDVVLDVADEATQLAYGVLLSGAGEIAVAEFKLEKVGSDVPTTGRKHRLERPSNLDFSEN